MTSLLESPCLLVPIIILLNDLDFGSLILALKSLFLKIHKVYTCLVTEVD